MGEIQPIQTDSVSDGPCDVKRPTHVGYTTSGHYAVMLFSELERNRRNYAEIMIRVLRARTATTRMSMMRDSEKSDKVSRAFSIASYPTGVVQPIYDEV